MSEELNQEPAVDTAPQVDVDALVAKAVEAELAKIKGNLDKAYGERDQYRKELEDAQKAKQDLEIKSLEEQGRATEALEARLKQQEEAMSKLMEQNTQLSRDTVVREQLAALDFSSEKAARMAASDVTSSLTRDSQGNWVGQNGESIGEVVQQYAQNEDNSFLFKAKLSQGSQTAPQQGRTQQAAPQQNKPFTQMTEAEVIAAAERGDFDNIGNWID